MKEYNVMITISATIWADDDDDCMDQAQDLAVIAHDPETSVEDVEIMDWCEA